MLLGYLVGAVGTYALLYKLAPVVAEDSRTRTHTPKSEVFDLFASSSQERGEKRKAA